MKIAALVVVSAFAGFIGAWFLFQPAAPTTIVASSPVERTAPEFYDDGAPSVAITSNEVSFDDIGRAPDVFAQLYTAWRLAAQAPDADALESLIDSSLDFTDPLYLHNIASVFLERYTAIDPVRAIQYIDTEPRLDQVTMKTHVLTSWVRIDPEGAIEFLRNISDRRVLEQSSYVLLQDPTLAAAGLRGDVIELLGEQRATSIMRTIETQRTDPAELFRSATLMTGNERRNRMQMAIARWANEDAEAAMDAIATLTSDFERNRMLNMAIAVYAQYDPQAAFDYVQLNFPESYELLLQPISHLAVQDIQGALRLAENYRQQYGDMNALTSVINQWATERPQEAIEYIASLTESDQQQLYPALAYTYLQRDPEAAMRWVLSLGDAFTNLKQSAMQIQTYNSMQAGERVLPSVTDSAVRRQLISRIAVFKSMSDPDSALTWLSDFQNEPAYLDALPGLIGSLAQNDPARAASFVDSIDSQDVQADSILTVAQHWYRRSPDSATRWLGSMPDSRARTQAISSLAAMSLQRHGLDSAIELVRLLPEGGSRLSASQQVLYALANNNPERLDEAFARLDIPDDLAERIRQQFNNR